MKSEMSKQTFPEQLTEQGCCVAQESADLGQALTSQKVPATPAGEISDRGMKFPGKKKMLVSDN